MVTGGQMLMVQAQMSNPSETGLKPKQRLFWGIAGALILAGLWGLLQALKSHWAPQLGGIAGLLHILAFGIWLTFLISGQADRVPTERIWRPFLKLFG